MTIQSTPIRVGRVVVGYVSGNTFYKSARASAHFLRVPPAICFDTSTLDDAENAGAHYAEVTDAESGRVYRAALSTIRAKGFRVNRGFGEQSGLSLIEWTLAGEGKQMALF